MGLVSSSSLSPMQAPRNSAQLKMVALSARWHSKKISKLSKLSEISSLSPSGNTKKNSVKTKKMNIHIKDELAQRSVADLASSSRNPEIQPKSMNSLSASGALSKFIEISINTDEASSASSSRPLLGPLNLKI